MCVCVCVCVCVWSLDVMLEIHVLHEVSPFLLVERQFDSVRLYLEY